MIRHTTVSSGADFNPFGGFVWHRRSMPITTLGRGQGSVAVKLQRLAWSATLESGECNLEAWRQQTKGFLSDQGTEKGIRQAPFGPKQEIDGVLEDIKQNRLSRSDERARKITFLPYALQQPGYLHVYFNALEECLGKVDLWKSYEYMLSGFVKMLGELSYNDKLLATSFKHVPREVRHKVHLFKGQHLDWRWEHLESLLEQIIDIYPTFVSHFKSEDFKDETSLCKKVKSGCLCPWFGPFSECCYVISHQVGREARWLEGCFCHEDTLITCSNWRKRVRSMQEATGADTCPWKGKRLPAFAMGHVSGVCERVRMCSSVRYRQALLAAPPEVSSKISMLESAVKTQWCSIIQGKFIFAESNPHNCVAAFAQYMGYPKVDCKAKVLKNFAEYNAVANKEQIAHTGWCFFPRRRRSVNSIGIMRTIPIPMCMRILTCSQRCRSMPFAP